MTSEAQKALDELWAEFSYKDKYHTRKPDAVDKGNYSKVRTALLEHEKMRRVLQGVRDALEQLMDDLSGGSMKYPNVGVCEAAWIQAEQQLANLDAVLSEGE